MYKKPLCIACSGGGGHISAINGLIETLIATSENIIIKQHPSWPHKKSISLYSLMLRFSIWALSNRIFDKLLHNILIKWAISGLPPYKEFHLELQRLITLNHNNNTRPYLDILLDLYPAGYEFVAIFNTLQRGDYLTNINTIVAGQPRSDRMNYRTIYKKILTILTTEAANDQPYTEIISTQPQSLAAMCDAVYKYNQKHNPIIIKLYLTDLPGFGANHFFTALKNLKPIQQQQIKIYAVCETQQELSSYFTHPTTFCALNNFSKYANPMIRSAFKNPELINEYSPHKTCKLINKFIIPANTNIATIMLGSLAGNACIEYAKYLVSTQKYYLIFVLRADNCAIDQELTNLSNTIVCLNQQSALELASIMVRSNCVILRGGGLSTMENLALPIIPQKKFYFHHPEQGNENKTLDDLTTGLSWEDTNIDHFIKHIRKHHAFAIKTTPQRITKIVS
jgi:effector protein SdbA